MSNLSEIINEVINEVPLNPTTEKKKKKKHSELPKEDSHTLELDIQETKSKNAKKKKTKEDDLKDTCKNF